MDGSVFTTLIRFLFVLFFFGLCIFVHELGHLLVALWRGLYVQRFSVGFGKKLWGTTIGGVEYVVSLLPFGGYVALPQLDPTDEPHEADGVPLPQASPSSRALTAVAGPLANVAFGFFLALFVWWIGVQRPAPADYLIVSSVPAESPEYVAGLRPGDRIFAVNGGGFEHGWEDVSQRITLATGAVTLAVQRAGETLEFTYTPVSNPDAEGLGYPFFRARAPIVVHRVKPGAPADAAGLRPGDRVLAVDDQRLDSTSELVQQVENSAGAPLELLIERDGRELVISGLRAKPEQEGDKQVHRIGVEFGSFVLVHPNPWEQFVGVYSQTRHTLRSLFARGTLVKPRHMSGPVGIMEIIWQKVTHGGFREGLAFVIFISFSLAFFNLLPIPVLDGGHIVFAGIETVTRRRVPTKLAYGLQTAFAVLLIGFMLYVTYFDVQRSYRIRRPAARQSAPEATAAAEGHTGAETAEDQRE